jgi:hypothetical protein
MADYNCVRYSRSVEPVYKSNTARCLEGGDYLTKVYDSFEALDKSRIRRQLLRVERHLGNLIDAKA